MIEARSTISQGPLLIWADFTLDGEASHTSIYYIVSCLGVLGLSFVGYCLIVVSTGISDKLATQAAMKNMAEISIIIHTERQFEYYFHLMRLLQYLRICV